MDGGWPKGFTDNVPRLVFGGLLSQGDAQTGAPFEFFSSSGVP